MIYTYTIRYHYAGMVIGSLLNQVRTVHTSLWMLKIDSVQASMCVRVCVHMRVPQRLLITSSIILTLHLWLIKFYSCYITTLVVIVDGHGLGIDTYHEN